MRALTVGFILTMSALLILSGRTAHLPGSSLAILALAAGFVVLAARWPQPPVTPRPRGTEEEIASLQEQGLLAGGTYHAVGAFTRGLSEMPHYFINLDDGRTLYLEGRYLENYDGKDGHPPVFPCTEFDLLYHVDEGYMVGLRCRGRVFTPQFTECATAYTYPPLDGELLTRKDCLELLEGSEKV